LLPLPELWNLPSLQHRSFYQRLFSPIVTLWYLIFQRLNPDHTLEAVVADANAGGADALCHGLSRKLRSTATTSYSNARQRLPLDFFLQAFKLQAQKIVSLDAQARWRGFLVSLLDGSTVRLRSYGNIPKHFAAHGNQNKGPAYWSLMRVVVSFCAFTGAALESCMAATRVSEQELACQIILSKSWASRLFIGDRNFGVFRIVQSAIAAGSHVLLRLSEPRARKLLGRSLALGQHAVCWSPSRFDQLQAECSKEPVEGQLLVVEIRRAGFRPQRLYLFTTLAQSADYPPQELVALYGMRWHIEMNLRYLKSQMHLVQLECKSAEMAKKEWLAGLMAYNLIRAAMFCAALRGAIKPLALSFCSSRRYLEKWLAGWSQGMVDWAELARWEKLLALILHARLPKRSKARPPEPRAQRHLREPFPPLIGCRHQARRRLNQASMEKS
jgi:Transposase DDE domain